MPKEQEGELVRHPRALKVVKVARRIIRYLAIAAGAIFVVGCALIVFSFGVRGGET